MKGTYRDYVIKDGRFIGRFEEMYSECQETPWHQDETAGAIFSDMDLVVLRHMKTRFGFSRVADIGCGLGYVTSRIHREVLEENDAIVGFDVSPTAVLKAGKTFPGIDFETLDITKPLADRLLDAFDLVVCKECHWYVLDHLTQFRENILRMTRKWVYVVQSFPEDRPYLGMDVFPSPEALVDFWTRAGSPEYHLVEWDGLYGGRPLVHLFLGKTMDPQSAGGREGE
ncbi:MAG: 23S rRNA methyltransferase A [Syntrophorhabdus sp. PtaB.Bin047]|jgi:SAM-dependent methyltransferase|nr:MAG: 23S rRNA methyltransferase A [Syntrophorhabdus sp. PtaB.Bin047]